MWEMESWRWDLNLGLIVLKILHQAGNLGSDIYLFSGF